MSTDKPSSPKTFKQSKNEEDNAEIEKMFDDETMASKINNNNADSANENFSDETRELNEKKLDAQQDSSKTESKDISKYYDDLKSANEDESKILKVKNRLDLIKKIYLKMFIVIGLWKR